MRPLICASLLLLLALFAAPSSRAAEPGLDDPELLADEAAVDDPELLAELAVQRQPSLEALRSGVEALEAVASVARLWSDPQLGAELSNLPVSAPWIDQHAMAGIQFKLQQKLPAPGELRARSAAADARVDAADAQIAALSNALRGEVRGRYWDLALVRQLRAITAAHVAELDGLLGAVDARYQVGVASQHDLLKLQLRRDRLAEALPDFDARALAIEAALNGALAREFATPISTPVASPVEALPADLAARKEALARHPDLLVLQARAAAERAEAARVLADAKPEPSVWLGYRVRAPQANGDPGTNFVTGGLSVPLPFAATRRGAALASAAEARARAAEASAASKRQRLEAALAGSEARHARAAARAVAYRDSLEDSARAALDSTINAYQVDRAGFSDLIRAEIDLLDVRRQRLRAEAEAASARAAILTLLGDALTEGVER